jgi:Sigma-70, region 4
VGAARWERTGGGQDDEQGVADFVNPVAPADRPANDAIRSWLVRGIHTFTIDPRRLGGRGLARRVLGEDRRLAPGVVGGWLEMVSALQRHTIHNALAHLSAEERQVVTLAYLEGHTNARIAAMLGVSVSTVRRRLWLALEHLDDYLRRAGTWVSAILLLGLLSAIGHLARLGRLANRAAAPDWPHKLVGAVAVGAVTVGGIGLVAANLHASSSRHSAPAATARLTPSLPGATRSALIRVLPLTSIPDAPNTPVITAVRLTHPSGTTAATTAAKVDSDSDGEQSEQEGNTVEESEKGDHRSPVADRSHHSNRGSGQTDH